MGTQPAHLRPSPLSHQKAEQKRKDVRLPRLTTAVPAGALPGCLPSSVPECLALRQRGQQQGWFKRMWESEVGFKTVHFWAPVMKWALVLAGVSDFARPAEKLSFTQNFALTCTGLIWTRWCTIIRPKNYLLAAVNFFLALVGITQLTRIAMHESAKKSGEQIKEDIKADVQERVEGAKETAEAAKEKIQQAKP